MLIASLLVGSIVLGVFAGAISTGIYWYFSPQEHLTQLSGQVKLAQNELRSFDGTDIRVVFSLTCDAFKLTLKQLGLILGPALLAAIPVLAIAWLVHNISSEAPNANWISTITFWTSLCVCSIGLKFYFKIK